MVGEIIYANGVKQILEMIPDDVYHFVQGAKRAYEQAVEELKSKDPALIPIKEKWNSIKHIDEKFKAGKACTYNSACGKALFTYTAMTMTYMLQKLRENKAWDEFFETELVQPPTQGGTTKVRVKITHPERINYLSHVKFTSA